MAKDNRSGLWGAQERARKVLLENLETLKAIAEALLEYETLDTSDIEAKMRALRRVGVPYTDEDIGAAGAEIANKTELDAMVAYLQGLGLALRNVKP